MMTVHNELISEWQLFYQKPNAYLDFEHLSYEKEVHRENGTYII